MLKKLVKQKARLIARKFNVPLRLAEQALWDRIDMRDEVFNRYPR